jgi:hypothetical protein
MLYVVSQLNNRTILQMSRSEALSVFGQGFHGVLVVTIVCMVLRASPLAQKNIFVPANDVSFVLSPGENSYGVREQIIVKYQIVNVSNGALFVPRGFEATVCLGLGPPHVWAGFENSSGQHFVPGYGASCSSTPGAALPTVTERMSKGAVLLKPGEHLDGMLQLDPTMFGGLPPGAYRIEAVLRGWQGDEFTDSDWTELAKMGSPFLRGEVHASAGNNANPLNNPFDVSVKATPRPAFPSKAALVTYSTKCAPSPSSDWKARRTRRWIRLSKTSTMAP